MIKKLSLGLAVLLTGVSAASLAQVKSPFEVTVPCYNGGFAFGVTGLYLKPTSANLDYLLIYPNAAGATNLSDANLIHGSVVRVKPDYDWGYSVNAGYYLPGTSNDLMLTYSSFNRTTKDAKTQAGNELFLSSLTPVTGLVLTNTLDAAHASANFNYQTLDVDFGQHTNIGCNAHVRMIGGVRLADLISTFDASYSAVDSDQNTVTTATHQKSEFKGLGPRVGTSVQYDLANGFGVVAQATGSLLVGNFNNHYKEHVISTDNDTLDDDVASLGDPKVTRVVPNLNAKLGLNYAFELCNATKTKLALEAGYQVDHYFNVADRIVEPSLAGLNVTKTIDTSFSGPYVSLQVKL